MISAFAFLQSCSTSASQAELQRDIEERQSAPFLVPGVELSQRGKPITFYPEAGRPIEKRRADKLLIVREPPRIIVPVRNAGEGVAIMLGERFELLSSCSDAEIENVAPPLPANPLGYYAVGSGESEQLGSLPAKGSDLAEKYENAFRAKQLYLLVRYTDVHHNKLRWTCIAYTREHRVGGWSLDYPVYGQAAWPESADAG